MVAPERIVHSESWDDWDVGEVLVTVELVERDGRTTLTSTALYPSQQVRDTLLESGMARGAGETYDRLAEMLASAVAEAPV